MLGISLISSKLELREQQRQTAITTTKSTLQQTSTVTTPAPGTTNNDNYNYNNRSLFQQVAVVTETATTEIATRTIVGHSTFVNAV